MALENVQKFYLGDGQYSIIFDTERPSCYDWFVNDGTEFQLWAIDLKDQFYNDDDATDQVVPVISDGEDGNADEVHEPVRRQPAN